MSAPLANRWAGPTDNNPGGAVQFTSDPNNNKNQTPSGNGYRPPDKEGGWLREAAFYAWIIGSDALSVAQQAATSLVAQVNYQDTVFGDRTRWSTGTEDKSDQAPWWQISVWLAKQIYAYDFLTAFESENAVSLFTAGERSAFQAWIEAFAEVVVVTDDNNYGEMYLDRAAYTPSGDASTIVGHSRPRYQEVGFTASRPEKIAIRYNNRGSRVMSFLGLAGLRFNNATNKAVALRWVKEYLRFGACPDGSCSDFERSESSVAEPTKGWKYSCEAVGMCNLFAHALWVTDGDASLFTESTADGLGESTDGVTEKSLKTVTWGLLRHVDDGYVRWIGDGSQVDDDRIKPGGPSSNATTIERYEDIVVGPILDHFLVATADPDANAFRDLYMRYAPNTYPQPTQPHSGQGNVEGGPSGVWPAALFCFGRT